MVTIFVCGDLIENDEWDNEVAEWQIPRTNIRENDNETAPPSPNPNSTHATPNFMAREGGNNDNDVNVPRDHLVNCADDVESNVGEPEVEKDKEGTSLEEDLPLRRSRRHPRPPDRWAHHMLMSIVEPNAYANHAIMDFIQFVLILAIVKILFYFVSAPIVAVLLLLVINDQVRQRLRNAMCSLYIHWERHKHDPG